MERRRIVQAALAAWAFKGIFLVEADAFKTRRSRGSVFNSSVDSTSAMLEMQWGSDYVDIPGTTEADGSLIFVLVGSGEETVVSHTTEHVDLSEEMGEHEEIHDLSEENACAAISMGAEGLEEGRILKLVDISDANACQKVCSKTLNCKAAQFNSEDSTCVLLKSFTGLTRATGKVVVLASCESDCFSQGEKLSGGGSSMGTVPNANMCQALCASNAACKGFTYMKSSNECLSFADDTDLSSDEDAISGSKESCTPHVQATQYTGSCTITNLSGTNLPELEVVQNIDSYEQCRKLCLTNPRCHYLTFNSADRKCYLKPGEGLVRFMKEGDSTGPRLCDGSCFLENIELTGEVLQTIDDRRSAHFCHFDCSMNESCAMWSFNEESKTCLLYAKSSDLTGRHSAGVWTGPKSACPLEALYEYSAPRCSLRGVRFDNRDPLKSTSTETAEACASECANSAMCEAFAYNVHKKKCDHLLAITESRKEDDVNYISGARYCGTSCHQQDTKNTGRALETFTGGFETAEECQLRCQATAGCTGWNFMPAHRSCKLFKSSSTTSSAGVIEGPKYCDGACDIPNHKLNPYGWTESANAGSVYECRNRCRENSFCRATTTYLDSCVLFDEFAFVRLEPMQNHHTSIASCSTCFREGVGYRVDDITHLWTTESQNAEECRIRCTFLENCTRFTYNAKTTTCYLLSGESGEISGTHLISGPANCEQPPNCHQKSVSFAGGTSAGTKAAKTVQQCQQLCQQHPECKLFNYHRDSKECQLFTDDALETKSNKGWVAGKKTCQTLSPWICADDNRDYFGGDVGKALTKVEDATACRDLCHKDPACETWMYLPNRKRCSKKTLQGYANSRPHEDAFSGARTGCPVCARWQRQYNGRVLVTKQTTNEALCQMECQLNSECNFFTFGPSNSCKLYSETGTVQRTVENIYSGPKRC